MTAPTSSDCDILINGGGMVGLALALGLAQEGFSVAVLDAQPALPAPSILRGERDNAEFDARVSALTAASQRWLQQLGVWEELEKLRVCAYRDMEVWDADGTGDIHFAAEEVHAASLGHIVENRLLCSVLQDALRKEPRVALHQQVLTGIRFAEQATERTTVETEAGLVLRCRLLIGADGGNSRVRELAGFATRRWSYAQQAIVCTIRSEKPHRHTAWQRFMQSGPLAVLPLQLPQADSQHFSSIVWSCDEPRAAELLALSDAAFDQALTEAFEAKLGAMNVQGARYKFPLTQQHAAEYCRVGVVLAGDAAHTIHPLAGQGVNLGFADAACLVQVLKEARGRGENIADLPTLSRYQRQRKGPNLAMMALMEGFKSCFGSDNLALRWLRNSGLRIANQHSGLKRLLIQQAMGF